MNRKILNPLNWRRSFLIWLLIGFVVLWFGFLDTYSLWTRYQLERQKKELIQETKALTEKTQELEAKINQLDNDELLLERIARERYGMRKPGENVYRIKD